MDLTTGLGLVAVVVLANGFFVATEFAIVAARRSRLDGLMPVHEFEELIGAEVKEPGRAGIATVSGLVMALLDRIPRVGDTVAVGTRRLRVEQLHGHRVAVLRLDAAPEPFADETRSLEPTP